MTRDYEKLEEENSKLHNLINNILQTIKQFFHRLLKIGTEKDKDDVVLGIKEYYTQNLYDNFDLHDIANNTSKEQEINDIIDNLKPTMINKNNFSISSVDVDKIKKYIKQTNDATSNLRDANSINIILKKYENDLRKHSNEVRNLNKKIETRDDKIDELEYALNDANKTIDELEDKVSKLQEALDYLKKLWQKFIEFLQDKFFSSNKYDEIVAELYHENIIDDNDLDIIQNNSMSKDKDDDFER